MAFICSFQGLTAETFPGCKLRCTCTRRRQRVTTRASNLWMLAPGIKVGRPKTSIKKDAKKLNEPSQRVEPEVDEGAAKARPNRKTQADEIPMYKVILLGDSEYEEGHVITQLQKVIPKMGKEEASAKFFEAQQTGSSIVCVVAQEHAEFYAQQLKRQDIFVIVEKDE